VTSNTQHEVDDDSEAEVAFCASEDPLLSSMVDVPLGFVRVRMVSQPNIHVTCEPISV